MAPQNWPKTVKMIRDELPKLLKSPQDVDELLVPDAVPYASLPQIVLDYPGFLRWLVRVEEAGVPGPGAAPVGVPPLEGS